MLRPFIFIRLYLRQVLLGLLAIALGLFFVVNTITGDRGLLSMYHIRKQIGTSELQLARLNEEREFWRNKVALMHPSNIDADQLDESVRMLLRYALPDDLVVFYEKTD